MNYQDEDTMNWKIDEDVLSSIPETEYLFYYKDEPPVRTPDFDELVPMDLNDIETPKQLQLLHPDQFRLILSGIALITLQGFRNINWSHMRTLTPRKDGDAPFCHFRRNFFTTLTKLVLNLYDVQDFQRAVDEVNINKSCKFFCDHLHELYGRKPESFKRAMADISKGKLDFNNFPYLREEDVGFTLGKYYMDCLKAKLARTHYFGSHVEVRSWPHVHSSVNKRFLVLDHHVSSVIKALQEYVPLTEEKWKLMMDLDKDCNNFVWGLCLEPWKDIQLQDFDIFETEPRGRWLDTMLRTFFLSFSFLSDLKANVLHMSKKNVMFPIECGVFGKFADEVLDVVGIANLERTRLGQRFLSGKLILSAIHRSSRIAKIVDKFIEEWDWISMVARTDYLQEEGEDRPCFYIYSLAHDVANNLDGDGTVKLEHMVLAIVFGRSAEWEVIRRQYCVVGFLEACNGDYASSSSLCPKKKKLKLTERGELLEDQLTRGLPKILDERIRYEKFLFWSAGRQLPVSDRMVEYVRCINDNFVNNKFDPRRNVFEDI